MIESSSEINWLSVISVIVSIPASIASAMAIYAFIAKPFKELNEKLDKRIAEVNGKLDDALARLNRFEGRFQQSDADNARKAMMSMIEDQRGGP